MFALVLRNHWILSPRSYLQNEFRGRIFSCSRTASGCQCAYPSSLPAEMCALKGEDVLGVSLLSSILPICSPRRNVRQALDIAGTKIGLYLGILVSITFVFRLLIYGVLVLKSKRKYRWIFR